VSDSTELIVLRLALIAVLFLFVIVAAGMLRSGLARPRPAPGARLASAEGRPRLVVLSPANSGLMPGDEFLLAGETTVGREAVNGIVLADASVSSNHAILERTARGWLLRDLGSTNGTFLEGRRVDGRGAGLKDGARITFGAVTVRFQG
jgi:hypothetical protein